MIEIRKCRKVAIATVCLVPVLFILRLEYQSHRWSKQRMTYYTDVEATQFLDRTNMTLPTAVEKFLTAARNCGIEVVVLQPSLLLPLLNESSLQLLQRRRIIPFTTENSRVFTFGTISTMTANGVEMMTLLEQSGDFVYERDEPKSSNVSQHHFLLMNRTLIHVTVLSTRSNFYYVPAVHRMPPRISQIYGKKDLFLGQFPAALERFYIEHVNISNAILPVPQPLIQLIAYLKWSRFLECNQTINEEYRRQNISQEKSIQLEKAFQMTIPRLKHLFDSAVTPFWIVSGTLLGWYRECGIIGHTTDIDLAAFIRDDPQKIYWTITDHSDLKILRKFGHPQRAFEITVINEGAKLDIFFTHEEKDYLWYAIHKPEYYFQLVYSKYSLCSAELLNLKVLVPCTPEAIIIQEYGTKWMTPDRNWEYLTSSQNKGKTFNWTTEEKILIDKV